MGLRAEMNGLPLSTFLWGVCVNIYFAPILFVLEEEVVSDTH